MGVAGLALMLGGVASGSCDKVCVVLCVHKHFSKIQGRFECRLSPCVLNTVWPALQPCDYICSQTAHSLPEN